MATSKPAAAVPQFLQKLGLFDSTMLIMGTMIGSGIFVTSQEIAADVGTAGWLLAVWVLAGVMTLMGALSYAELAAMMPYAGGQYVYLRESYSPLWGFLYGWTCFLVIQTGSIAAVAVVFAKYLGVLYPTLGTQEIIYTYPNVDLELYLPFMQDPFFTMKDFTISAGQLVAVVVIALLTWINCLGVQEGKIVQNIFTLAKTLALVILIGVGLMMANPHAWMANSHDWWAGIQETNRYRETAQKVGGGALAALMVAGGAMVGSLFSADAWSNITFTAGEIRNPRRNMPLSLMLGAGSVVLLYVLANVAYVVALPVKGDLAYAEKMEREVQDLTGRAAALRQAGKLEEASAAMEQAESRMREAAYYRGIDNAKDARVGTAVMELLSPRWGAPFMAIAIMVSTFGCVNGLTLMGARLYYVMAQDNVFFRSVGVLNRRGVPAVALVLQGLWSAVLVFSGTYGDLLDYVIFAVLVFYVLTVAGLFILRRTRPDAERPYRALGYPVMPAVYVVLCAVIMLDLLVVKPRFTWPGLIIVVAGIPVYFLWRLTHARR